ncbi:MAG: hypothetical protein HYZ01_06200 [Ignavibacteriales bacterium]|nr:hypothetical protein [Ignavibacteriales bacterium]
METKSYEFTTEQNNTLRQLSKKMKSVGIFLFIAGGLTIVSGIQDMMYGGNLIFSVVTGTIYILMGMWTFRAGKAFERVVQTEGNDIDHLMLANGSLLSLYTMQFWLIIVAVVFIVIAMLVAVGSGMPASQQS